MTKKPLGFRVGVVLLAGIFLGILVHVFEYQHHERTLEERLTERARSIAKHKGKVKPFNPSLLSAYLSEPNKSMRFYDAGARVSAKHPELTPYVSEAIAALADEDRRLQSALIDNNPNASSPVSP